ncbi:MAG TPA: hypothetical protein VM939_01585, partial [Gemmatimonadaceae bacterium]|nr:hypothetical protein [Gemmatimonadaceae bacterium]
YEASMNSFHRALQIDSTFALAAIGLFKSANWVGSELVDVAASMAIRFRDKLSGADHMLVAALGGPDYPLSPTYTHILSALDSATKLGPDQPDIWFEYGDIMFHFGRTIGITNAFTLAQEAFERAYALDSSLAPAIEHLLEFAVLTRDTPRVRRLVDKYVSLDSAADHVEYVRWRGAMALGDRATIDALRKKPRIDGDSRARILGTGLVDGIGMQDVQAILSERIRSQGDRISQFELEQAVSILFMTGREKQASQMIESNLRLTSDTLRRYADWLAAMIYTDASTAAEADVVAGLRRQLLNSASTAERQAEQHGIACILAVHAARGGDLRTVREMKAILYRTVAGAQADRLIGRQSLCLAFVDGVLEMSANPAGTAPVLTRLDRLSRMGYDDFFVAGLHIELARMYEQGGNRAKALEVLGRRVYHWSDGRVLLTTYLREEGRLAAEVGDKERAAKALRHFIALREGADDRYRPQTERMRALLAQVENRR